MSQKSSDETRCQHPKELKDKVENCSKEQIEKCHGREKDHPCATKI